MNETEQWKRTVNLKNDPTKLDYRVSYFTYSFTNYIEIAIRIKEPEDLTPSDYHELELLKNHLSIYQFIRWMELKATHSPTDDPKYWAFTPEDIPYPPVDFKKWSDEVFELKNTMIDLRKSYEEKLKKMKIEYEAQIIALEIHNEKLRRKLSAFQTTATKRQIRGAKESK